MSQESVKDYSLAVSWLEKAVVLDDTYSINKLATLYSEGGVVEKDEDKANALFQKLQELEK